MKNDEERPFVDTGRPADRPTEDGGLVEHLLQAAGPGPEVPVEDVSREESLRNSWRRATRPPLARRRRGEEPRVSARVGDTLPGVMSDASPRPCGPPGARPFAGPRPKLVRMLDNIGECFLITETWGKVRARISRRTGAEVE